MTRGAPVNQEKKNYYYIKSTNGNLARVLGDHPELFTKALEYKYAEDLDLSIGDLQAIHDYSSKWVNRIIGRKQPIDFNKMSEYLCANIVKIRSAKMANDRALNYWFMQMIFIIIKGMDNIPDNFFNYYLHDMFTNKADEICVTILPKLDGDQFRTMKMYVVEHNYSIDDFVEMVKDCVPYMDSYCKEYFYTDLPTDYQLGIVL